jgi:hypothetical protein
MCKFPFLISIVKPTRCTISQIYFILEYQSTWFGGPSVQHQESKTVHTASGVCHTSSTPDDGRKDRTKHVECFSKIKSFWDILHLVGFTIEIYYDARSYKRQISNLEIGKNARVTDFGLTLQRVTWKITCNFLQKIAWLLEYGCL